MEIKLSILMLTHKRPELFDRALKSAILNKPKNIEIIINNDSDDIDIEYYKQFGEVHTFKSYYISDIYNYLLGKAKGEYIYFLEDDDYLVDDFYSKIEYTNSVYKYIPDSGIKATFEYFKNYGCIDDHFYEYFQLGQILFKKKDITTLMSGNSIHNDIVYFKNINDWKFINKFIYYQTTDAKDNISYVEYNTDERFF